MLPFLRSMSVAEILTTLAAWLGLALGIYNAHRAYILSKVRISIKMQVITRDSAGGMYLLIPEMFSNPEIIPLEVRQCMKSHVALALQVINKSMFPVYISSCGLCQRKSHSSQRVAAIKPLLAFGVEHSKDFRRDAPVTFPFLLNSKETVVLELHDFEIRKDTLQELLSLDCCLGYAQTADGVIKTENCRTLIERLKTIVPK
jgi:hypothetical protein